MIAEYQIFPQIFHIVMACTGSFLGGTQMGFLSHLDCEYKNRTEAYKFKYGYLIPFGAALACVPSGIIKSKLGTKDVISIFCGPILIGWLLIWLGEADFMIWIGKLLTGMSIGCFFTVLPPFIAEVAAKELRGLLLSIFFIMFISGSLFSYVLALYCNSLILFIIIAVSALTYCFLTYISAQTPLYLVSKGEIQDANEVLKQFRGKKYVCDSEINELQERLQTHDSGSCWNLIKIKSNLRAFTISTVLLIFYVFCGAGAMVSQYTNFFFEKSGLFPNGMRRCDKTIEYFAYGVNPMAVTGTVLLLSAILGSMMAECVGRRVLLITSSIGMAISQLSLAIMFSLEYSDIDISPGNSFYLIFYGFFLIFFAIGLGPVTFVIYGELFRADAQQIIGPIAMTIFFLLQSTMTKVVEILHKDKEDDWLRNLVLFYVFCASSVMMGIFAYKFIPETNGKSLLEVHQS